MSPQKERFIGHNVGCPALEDFRSEKKRVAILKGEPIPTFRCTCSDDRTEGDANA